MVLAPYLEEWDSMTKTVLVDGLSKEQAYKYEDNIIQALKMNNLCINSNRSGLIADDINAYQREYLKDNPEYHEQHKQKCKQWQKDNPDYMKQYYENNKEKVLEYQKQYYEKNKEKISEYYKQYYKRKKLEKQQQTSVH